MSRRGKQVVILIGSSPNYVCVKKGYLLSWRGIPFLFQMYLGRGRLSRFHAGSSLRVWKMNRTSSRGRGSGR